MRLESSDELVWIYAVLTLIQTRPGTQNAAGGLDVCRISSYSNCNGGGNAASLFGYMPY